MCAGQQRARHNLSLWVALLEEDGGREIEHGAPHRVAEAPKSDGVALRGLVGELLARPVAHLESVQELFDAALNRRRVEVDGKAQHQKDWGPLAERQRSGVVRAAEVNDG